VPPRTRLPRPGQDVDAPSNGAFRQRIVPAACRLAQQLLLVMQREKRRLSSAFTAKEARVPVPQGMLVREPPAPPRRGSTEG